MKYALTEKEISHLIHYWTKNAEEDLITADSLFKAQRYHHCLFFSHLFLEKLLKAIIIKRKRSHALPIHNLLKLAHDSHISVDKKLELQLATINEFNIRARYNDYKFEFYKKASQKYANLWFNRCKEIYLWLKKELQKI